MTLRSKLILMFAVLIIVAVSVLTAYSSYYQRETYIRNEMMTQKQVLSLIHNNVSVQLYAFTNEQLQGVLSVRNMLHEKGQTLSHRIAEMQASIEANYGVKFNDFPSSSEPKSAWTKEQLEAERMFLNFLAFEKASYNQVGSDIVATYDSDVIIAPIHPSISEGVSVSNRSLLPTMLTTTNQYSAGYYLSIFNREFSTVANLADNIASSSAVIALQKRAHEIAPAQDHDHYFSLEKEDDGRLIIPEDDQSSDHTIVHNPQGSQATQEVAVDSSQPDMVLSLGKNNAFSADKFNNRGQGARVAIGSNADKKDNSTHAVVLGDGSQEQMLLPQLSGATLAYNKHDRIHGNKSNYLAYLFKTEMDSPFTFAIVQSVDSMIEQYVDVEGKVLSRIQEHVDDLNNYLKGEALIIDSKGKVLSSSHKEPLFTQAPEELYEYMLKQRQVQIDNKAIYGDLSYEQNVKAESFTFKHDGKVYLVNTLYFRPLGWFIVNAVDLDTIVDPAVSSAMVLVAIGAIIMVLSILLAAIFSNSLARRLTILATKAKVMSSTNLSDFNAVKEITDSITVTGKDEVAELSNTFKLMGKSISRNINLLMTANSQKNRMEGELNAAKDIQMGMLPNSTELPQSEHLANAALLYPAKEVGGDLFDIYRLDNHHIIYAVGDVSDKGVPAALFMSTTVTLARACLCMGMSPQATMTLLNGRLSERNPNMMFVTMYIAILDERTGQVVASNAGHCLPIIIRREVTTEDQVGQITFDNDENRDELLEPEDLKLKVVKVEEIDEISGPAVGPIPGIEYSQYSFELGEYDMMLLYTDGVSEAQNEQGGFFGVERILEITNKSAKLTPQGLIKALNDEVSDYRGYYAQSDDITMVACSRFGAHHKQR